MLRSGPQDLSVIPASNGPTQVTPPDLAPDPIMTEIADKAMPAGAKREGDEGDGEGLGKKMLRLVREAITSSDPYTNFTRKGWQRAYKAFRNQHFEGSKYLSTDYKARSKLFRPKTRSSVRKAMAATRASLFSTTDAIAISAGNESDQLCRANAALMQEVINYRTDRTSGRNAFPWFKSAMGGVQDATITGIVVSIQTWKLETKQVGEQPVTQVDPVTQEVTEVFEVDEETGEERPAMQPTLKTVFDRPDLAGIPPENVIIDAGANWLDPAQSAAFLILQWPMKIDEIRQRENDPRDPWHHLEDSVLKGSRNDRSTGNAKGIRSSREGGTDRMDPMNQGDAFSTIWVNQCFVRSGGEDYTFFSLGDQHLLTEPKTVDEVYPWNDGERPVVIGYGSLEAHKIFPMSPAESWQPLQQEINDLANLTIDTVKMNIAPVAKVVRGRQVDLDALRKRAPGTNLLMNAITDVEFDKPPGVDAGAWQQMERLNNDFDTLAGQFDQSSVMSSRSLNETVGGMRLLSGAANALQEFDQAVFIETWAEPALAQIVRLCQYYEHDETILGLCGDRAKLWEKHGVNQITDALIDSQILMRIDIGIGAGDPQQRLAKFQMATAASVPLLKDHPKFRSGEWELDAEAIMQETYGAAGYRDGGMRFIKKNPPKQGPDPAQQLEIADKQADIAQKRSAANLNDQKAAATAQEARQNALELIKDLLESHLDNQHRLADRTNAESARVQDRQDTQRTRIEDRTDAHQQRQETRHDTREARREDHQLAQRTEAMRLAARRAATPT